MTDTIHQPAARHGRTRRSFLLASAAGVGGAILAGCGGDGGGSGTGGNTPASSASPSPSASSAQQTTGGSQGGGETGSGQGSSSKKGSSKSPLKAPAKLTEAPEFAALVKAGKLPELSKRLPENPYVIPHNWVERGKYGGSLKMNIVATADGTVAEYFYGFSPLRLLNDGITVGPGVAEKWETNADTSEWTFHFRKGLKWSDGKPWTTADIMFWWKYMANYDAYTAEGVPDECKSGKGTIAKFTAVDDYTLKITFDAPTPLTAIKMASYVNGCRGNGASWMAPAHYVKQFHPEFNKKVPKSWSSPGGQWETHCDYKANPKCPTITAFRLKDFHTGKSQTWERNPYSYVVSRDGDQLPYLDGIVMSVVQDPQVGKLQITQGSVDYAHGPFNAIQLADVSTLMSARKKSAIDVFFWDTDSGTAAITFLNYDYKDDDYRKLFREPKFRQALSHAFNRKEARQSIYFNQGEPTTGTVGPKGSEFVVPADGPKYYKNWMESYVEFDQAKAKKLLDSLGVVDKNGDGLRELPNGRKLQLRIDLQADATDEFKHKDNQLVRDWKAVGIDARVHPVPPDSFGDYWADGTYMIHSDWEASGPVNSLLTNASWMVPIEPARWAPLEGQMYAVRGTKAEHQELDVDPYKRKPPRMAPEKGGPVEKLWKLLDESKVEPDTVKRNKLFFQMCKIMVSDGPFFMGTVANYPAVEVVKNGLMNVPRRDNLYLGGATNPWGHPTPAVYDLGTFFWDEPSKHEV